MPARWSFGKRIAATRNAPQLLPFPLGVSPGTGDLAAAFDRGLVPEPVLASRGSRRVNEEPFNR